MSKASLGKDVEMSGHSSRQQMLTFYIEYYSMIRPRHTVSELGLKGGNGKFGRCHCCQMTKQSVKLHSKLNPSKLMN